MSRTAEPGEQPADPSSPAGDPTTARQMRIDELVAILGSWDPRERGGAIKAWLRGSLSLIHLHVLTSLETSGPLPMSHLADAMDVSVASATGIVGRMEERGLVARRHGDVDRRIVRVEVTEAGHDVFRSLDAVRREHFQRILERLTDADLDGLVIGLRATRQARAALAAEMTDEHGEGGPG